MERMQFKTEINAPVSTVFDTMLGKETFKRWTAVFNPSSEFEGEWKKGSKVLFIGTTKEGKREGMVGKIKAFEPRRFVSIEYVGILDGEKEITDGPEVEKWTGFEDYTFEEKGDQTTVIVDIDVNEEMQDYFEKTYPKALEKLKEICE